MLAIFSSVPVWAWAVGLYLLAIGLKATRRHRIFLPSLFIPPVILLGLCYSCVATWSSFQCNVFYISLVAGVIMGLLAYFRAFANPIRGQYTVEVPGNHTTLLLCATVFALKFYFGYYHATHAAITPELLFGEIIATGFFPGFFLGRALSYVRLYYKNS